MKVRNATKNNTEYIEDEVEVLLEATIEDTNLLTPLDSKAHWGEPLPPG